MPTNEDGSTFRILDKTTAQAQLQCSNCKQWHAVAQKTTRSSLFGAVTQYRAYCNPCQLVLEYTTLDRASAQAGARLTMPLSAEEKDAKTAFMMQFRAWWQHADHIEAGRPYGTLAYVIDRIIDPVSRGLTPPDDIWQQLKRVWEQGH